MRAAPAFLSSVLLLSGCAPWDPPSHPTEPSPPVAAPGAPSITTAEGVIRGPIHAQAKRCYQAGLNSDPSMAGRVVIRIHIASDGTVDDSIVASDEGLATSVAECIAAGAKRAHFEPPGESGSTISIPFNFVRMSTVDAGAR
jgi:hypothetical protein